MFECLSSPDTYAQSAAVSGATSKPVSCRTPADRSPSGICPAGHPPLRSPSGIRPAGHPLTAEPSKVRLLGLVTAWGSVRVKLRVLRPDGRAENPDGDVRQDIGLLVARDTGAQSAQVSWVCDTSRHVVSGRGHRFTAPDGVPPYYRTLSGAGSRIFAEVLSDVLTTAFCVIARFYVK